MTKDWDVVQEEIKELSFNQKKSLEEVKELMERKHNFRASTRAYRMKLKEWGLMRHKPRKTVKEGMDARAGSQSRTTGTSQPRRERDSSATVEPISLESTPSAACENTGRWQIAINADTPPEPTFMSLLGSEQDLRPTLDPLAQARNRASTIVLDMLNAILDNDSQKLEKLIVENVNHVNDPIGEPFDNPSSRFFGHPALDQMVILQHPDQTLLDVACGMPCGPIIWVLLSHGAKGSRHPLGTDLALHNAIKNGRPYTVQALLVPGRSNVNGEPESTWRPLRQAVFWNVPDVVRILLNRGANIDDAGPSPFSMRDHTALELCLEYRSPRYHDTLAMDRCHQILKMLLDTGASIHGDLEGSAKSPFERFIKPWQNTPYWAPRLSTTELDALRLFVGKGANLQTHFEGFPCGSPNSKTVAHQLLWHSTPSIARLLIDSFAISSHNNECSLLYEVLGSCPDAKRHPTDTLRDVEVLLQKGVDPNLADMDGKTPLMKCIMSCPAVDLVSRLRVLLEGGAWPEFEDYTGVPAYVYAARTFEEPLLSEVMELLVSKITGRLDRLVNNVSHAWADDYFPIAETQTYEQVMSCTRQSGDFMLNMHDMVPDDAQSAFQRAYFNIASKRFLDTMSKVATTKTLNAKVKEEIVWIISMRKNIGLPDHNLDQELVVALLDPLFQSRTSANAPAASAAISTYCQAPSTNTVSTPDPSLTTTTTATSPATHAPFTFNPNNPTAPRDQSPNYKRPDETDSLVEDFFAPSTTQIRWKNPDAPPRPGDFSKAVAAVLQYECEICGRGTLLTKKEHEKHGVEHAHTEGCEEGECTRRFCMEKRRKEKETEGKERNFQSHVFGKLMEGVEGAGCNPRDTTLDFSTH